MCYLICADNKLGPATPLWAFVSIFSKVTWLEFQQCSWLNQIPDVYIFSFKSVIQWAEMSISQLGNLIWGKWRKGYGCKRNKGKGITIMDKYIHFHSVCNLPLQPDCLLTLPIISDRFYLFQMPVRGEKALSTLKHCVCSRISIWET